MEEKYKQQKEPTKKFHYPKELISRLQQIRLKEHKLRNRNAGATIMNNYTLHLRVTNTKIRKEGVYNLLSSSRANFRPSDFPSQ